MVTMENKTDKKEDELNWKYVVGGNKLHVTITAPSNSMSKDAIILRWAIEYYSKLRETLTPGITVITFQIEYQYNSLEKFDDYVDKMRASKKITELVNAGSIATVMSGEGMCTIPGIIPNRQYDIDEHSMSKSVIESLRHFELD